MDYHIHCGIYVLFVTNLCCGIMYRLCDETDNPINQSGGKHVHLVSMA